MDREQSFYATLGMFKTHVNLLESLHGKPAMATISSFSGGFFTGRPQTHDHSDLLGMRPDGHDVRSEPLRLHFGYTADGYILTLKNSGEHYNKQLGKHWFEVLGARDQNTRNPTLFTLADPQNNLITREKITSSHTPISLMTDHKKPVGGLRLRGSPYLYLAETEERSKVMFILSLL
ncbi:hypothetical protein [Pseudomonas sp. St316]|uniref:hypothetical protein n=1 Tax=Pseudomonas sp. St316 TaxID=2678257 RepID=UPI001BB377A5|nr:hypothetical protein [Pseudomonas sp. St316]BBP57212.1 hypothetical protein PHLH4_08020 [Pseudomonas sp. St316]